MLEDEEAFFQFHFFKNDSYTHTALLAIVMKNDMILTDHLIRKGNQHFTTSVKHPLQDKQRRAHELNRITKGCEVPKILDTPSRFEDLTLKQVCNCR